MLKCEEIGECRVENGVCKPTGIYRRRRTSSRRGRFLLCKNYSYRCSEVDDENPNSLIIGVMSANHIRLRNTILSGFVKFRETGTRSTP